MKVKVAQSGPTVCDPTNCIVHGILQARMQEWVAFPFSRGFSQSRDRRQVSCIAGRFFTNWAIREALISRIPWELHALGNPQIAQFQYTLTISSGSRHSVLSPWSKLRGTLDFCWRMRLYNYNERKLPWLFGIWV